MTGSSSPIMDEVDALMRRYEPMIGRRVTAAMNVMRGNMVDADDLRQQVRMKLWKGWQGFRRPNAVIHTLVFSVCCDAVRKDKRTTCDLLEEIREEPMRQDETMIDEFDEWFAERFRSGGDGVSIATILFEHVTDSGHPLAEPEIIDRLRTRGFDLHRGPTGIIVKGIRLIRRKPCQTKT